MNLLDKTFPSPEQNLACDEVLLDLVEDGYPNEILRFWESSRYFVVLGSSNKYREEADVDACRTDGIPILRRHSGGGTVLQGPGCLNYSLILKITPDGPCRNITETTKYVMHQHAECLSGLTGEQVEMKGSSDLTIGVQKFSGNAQRRRMKALLFHGTFLLNFDLPMIEEYLKMPAKQPEYRGQRSHLKFVRNIPIAAEQLRKSLCELWKADMIFRGIPIDRIDDLVTSKYSSDDWNLKL